MVVIQFVERTKGGRIAAAPTSMVVEQVFASIDVKGRTSFAMQGTQPHELLPGPGAATALVLPLQVLQQRKALVELFQVLAHGAEFSLPGLSVRQATGVFQARMVDGSWLLRGARARTE